MYKIIITAGEKYNDIDALACAVAYKNLLDLQGITSEVILTGPLNDSVTKSILNWDFTYKKVLDGDAATFAYVLVDISDHNEISTFVPLDKIIEVYDHRWGYETYWKTRPDVNTVIDPVGSCATLIWEKFKDNNFQDKIDPISANLLYTAIISNTLNLGAQITNERDLLAILELKKFIDLPKDWVETYFNEVTASVLADPKKAMINDTKIIKIVDDDFYIMQIELWDSRKFIDDNKILITDLLISSGYDYAFLTSPSISEGENYIIAVNDSLKDLLSKTIDAKFVGNIGITKKLWLRKEIIRELAK